MQQQKLPYVAPLPLLRFPLLFFSSMRVCLQVGGLGEGSARAGSGAGKEVHRQRMAAQGGSLGKKELHPQRSLHPLSPFTCPGDLERMRREAAVGWSGSCCLSSFIIIISPSSAEDEAEAEECAKCTTSPFSPLLI